MYAPRVIFGASNTINTIIELLELIWLCTIDSRGLNWSTNNSLGVGIALYMYFCTQASPSCSMSPFMRGIRAAISRTRVREHILADFWRGCNFYQDFCNAQYVKSVIDFSPPRIWPGTIWGHHNTTCMSPNTVNDKCP
jgi:hypothetical protein